MPKERPREERMTNEDMAWSHLSFSNASLTGLCGRVAGVAGVAGLEGVVSAIATD